MGKVTACLSIGEASEDLAGCKFFFFLNLVIKDVMTLSITGFIQAIHSGLNLTLSCELYDTWCLCACVVPSTTLSFSLMSSPNRPR